MRVSNIHMMLLTGALVSVSGCAPADGVQVEYYKPAYRQLGPEPVYSRLTWSHLPEPIRPKERDSAPLFMPVLEFDLPKANAQEAIEALAQTIGYRWECPSGLPRRPIAVKMVGTVEEILAEISRQAEVRGVLDHENRIVRVLERETQPALPAVE